MRTVICKKISTEIVQLKGHAAHNCWFVLCHGSAIHPHNKNPHILTGVVDHLHQVSAANKT